MKISLSNIAWSTEDNDTVAGLLHEFNVSGVDLALSKCWPDPLQATQQDIDEVRAYWSSQHIQIVGVQSIHYGHPELQLFGSDDQRNEMEVYTTRMIALCGAVGVSRIVFGSPKNRLKGLYSDEQALDIAVPFFQRLGDEAAKHNIIIGIEPNASDYGCDFIRTGLEGLTLVKQINHDAVRLHLDTGNMMMMKENIPDVIASCIDWVSFFHVSEPHLAPVGGSFSDKTMHRSIATALKTHNYSGWLSIEMRQDESLDVQKQVSTALSFVTSIYA